MGTVVKVSPVAIVTRDEAKRFMRVSGTDQDSLIEMLLLTCQAEIEPPDSWIGRAFGVQTLVMTLDGCELYPSATIDLPFPPLRSIESFTYIDESGIARDIAPSVYVKARRGEIARLALAYGQSWPSPRREPAAVTIEFTAGYEAGDLQLEPARMALILMAQRLYGMAREDILVRREVVDGVGSTEWALSSQGADMAKDAAETLLKRYRVWSF